MSERTLDQLVLRLEEIRREKANPPPVRGDIFAYHQNRIAEQTARMPEPMRGIMGAYTSTSPSPKRSAPKQPTFASQRAMLLSGLAARGWTVVSGLKVPHASYGESRLWFKSQAIYLSHLGSDPRNFANAHSLSSDMREYKSADQLIEDVARMRIIQRKSDEKYGR